MTVLKVIPTTQMTSFNQVLFEKLKVTKLKNDLLDNLRVEIKDIIKKN